MSRLLTVFALAVGLVVPLAVVARAEDPKTADARPTTIGSVVVSCDSLPKDAVRAVPHPFDRFMSIDCTRSGQALRPVPGYRWQFPEGTMWLSATNPKAPSAEDHYVELAVIPMTPRGVSAVRAELHKITQEPAVFLRDIIRMDVTTSWGEHKQLFLLVPPAGAPPEARVLGMECIHYCIPIDKDPWFFTVLPDAPAGAPPKP